MTSGPVPIELHLTPAGYGSRVVIDGTDLSEDLLGLTLDSQAGELTTLTLRLKPGSHGAVTGEVLVQRAPQDMVEQLAGMLEDLDPAALEAAALESPDLDNEPYALTRELLRAAAGMLRGRP